jgi:outer membrane protein, heavy metal efflux system
MKNILRKLKISRVGCWILLTLLLFFLISCSNTATMSARGTSFTSHSLSDPKLNLLFGRKNLPSEQPWEPKDLFLTALYYSPVIKTSQNQESEARAAIITAGQITNPTMSFKSGYTANLGLGVIPWILGTAGDFLWETNQRRPLRVAEAELRASSFRWRQSRVAWQVRSAVYSAFIDLQTAKNRSNLALQQITNLQGLQKLLAERVQIGAVAPSDGAAAMIALIQSRIDLVEIISRVDRASATLKLAVGISVTDPMIPLKQQNIPWSIVKKLPVLINFLRYALIKRSDLRASLIDFEAVDVALKGQLARQVPNLHLAPSYQWSQEESQWQLGLTSDLPIFNLNEGPIAEARARRETAKTTIQLMQNSIEAEVFTADQELNSAVKAAINVKELTDVQERLRIQTEQSQLNGGSDRVEVLRSRSDETRARLQLLDAERRVFMAIIALETSTETSLIKLD